VDDVKGDQTTFRAYCTPYTTQLFERLACGGNRPLVDIDANKMDRMAEFKDAKRSCTEEAPITTRWISDADWPLRLTRPSICLSCDESI
jgi:hypothetical protein